MSDRELYKILETFDNLESATDKLKPVTDEDLNKNQLEEAMTKVEKQGNKVRVTKDGDTTEFNDEETAQDFLGGEDDDVMTTEAEEVVDEDADEVTEEEEVTEEDKVEEGIEDEWDIGGDEYDELAAYKDILPKDEPVVDFDADDLMGIEDEDDFDIEEGAMCEEPEFATFNADDETHRRRLQRGTPVVLSPELFNDPKCNRRGVFVNRSPSGFFGTVIRDCDGKEVNVHLSDIVSAELVNNSIYEAYNIDFEKLMNEEITMTQTSNLENPENDTTTITAVGQEAGDELAAMMANAGLNTGEYDAVDTGLPAEPEAPAEPDMKDHIAIVDDEWDDLADTMDIVKYGDEPEREPTDADLDAIEADPEMDFELAEAGVSHDIDYQHIAKILDRFPLEDVIQYVDGSHPNPIDLDMAFSEEYADEIPYGYQNGDDGTPAEWMIGKYEDEFYRYIEDHGGVVEARDIEHANTPDERTADVDVVTHGTSGGLNKPKRMYKPAGNRHGDNAMQRPMDDMYEEYMAELDEDEYGRDQGAMYDSDSYKYGPYETRGDAGQAASEETGGGEEGWNFTTYEKEDGWYWTEEVNEGEKEEKPKVKSGDDFRKWLQDYEDWKDEEGLGGSRRPRGSMRRGTEGGVRFESEELEESDSFLDLYKAFQARGEKKS